MAGCSGETADRCQNGGSCVLVDETEVCNCTSKFAGDHCEMDVSVKRPCEDWICHNGGVCHLVSRVAMCTILVHPFCTRYLTFAKLQVSK